MPHSPSPSQKSPTVTELDSQCGVLPPKDDWHSEAAMGRRQLPLHGSQPDGHADGGDGEDEGDSHRAAQSLAPSEGRPHAPQPEVPSVQSVHASQKPEEPWSKLQKAPNAHALLESHDAGGGGGGGMGACDEGGAPTTS